MAHPQVYLKPVYAKGRYTVRIFYFEGKNVLTFPFSTLIITNVNYLR